MRICYACNKYGCLIVEKSYNVNNTLLALEKFEKYLKKNNIEFYDIDVKVID